MLGCLRGKPAEQANLAGKQSLIYILDSESFFAHETKEGEMKTEIIFETRPDGTNIMRVTFTAEEPGDKANLSTAHWYAPKDPNKWATENVIGSNHYVERIDLVLPLEKLSE